MKENNKIKVVTLNNHIYLFLVLILFSCGQPKQAKDNKISNKVTNINGSNKNANINRDSLIKVVFNFSEHYFNLRSDDSIRVLRGEPKYISKSQCGETSDSILTIKYTFFTFNFLERGKTKLGLESMELLDKNITLVGNLSIGISTRNDIIQAIGLPDLDHNDPGRSLSKSGDTTVYGSQSGAGDTVTFVYYFYTKNDDYAISFSMTNDTLRKVTWSRNML
jgi:hypothetical protein